MIPLIDPLHGGAFDWNIAGVLDAPNHPGCQHVIVACGCVAVYAPMTEGAVRTLVGYGRMCYAHESFKLLARVWQSAN